MRTISSMLAATVLAVFAGPAQAAPAEFNAVVSIEVSGFDAVEFEGSGVGDTTGNGPATLPEGSIVAGFTSRITEPLLGIIPGFSVCAPGQNDAVFPIPVTPGEAIADCDPLENGQLGELTYDGESEAEGPLVATAYLTNNANTVLVAIPLSIIGVGGTETFSVLGSPASLTANPWTTDEVTVTGGLAGSDPTTFTDSGFDNRDEAGAGELKLVTTALAELRALGSVPAIARLNITFAPEPGTAAIGLAAFGALATIARRKRSA